MDDELARLVEALPKWLNPAIQRGVVIAELLINLRRLPSGEVELTVAHPLPRDSDKVLRVTGSVDEFVQLAHRLDALFSVA